MQEGGKEGSRTFSALRNWREKKRFDGRGRAVAIKVPKSTFIIWQRMFSMGAVSIKSEVNNSNLLW